MYLKEFREELGLSQKEFAERLDLTQVTIARYETNKMNPTTLVIEKYIKKFNANPNYLFLGIEPKILTFEDNNISSQTIDILKDINNIMSTEEINSELNKILINKTIDCIASGYDSKEKTSLRKFLESLQLEGDVPFRPLLFLYYMFRYVNDNTYEIEKIEKKQFQQYLINLVLRYKVISWKNNPVFTSKIKSEIQAAIEIHMSEKDCEMLITNYSQVLESLESKMSSTIVRAHRKIDTNTLFPKD